MDFTFFMPGISPFDSIYHAFESNFRAFLDLCMFWTTLEILELFEMQNRPVSSEV